MKKGVLFAFILISAVSFASAASMGELLSSIDQSTVIFLAVFLISFSLLFFSLNKVFKKQNTTTSGIISAALAFLLVYWVNKSEFDVEGSLYDLGINSNILYTLLPIVIAAAIIFLLVKFKTKALYIIIAALVLLGLFILKDISAIIVLGVIVLLFALVIYSVLKFLGISVGKGKRSMSHREAARYNQDAGAGI